MLAWPRGQARRQAQRALLLCSRRLLSTASDDPVATLVAATDTEGCCTVASSTVQLGVAPSSSSVAAAVQAATSCVLQGLQGRAAHGLLLTSSLPSNLAATALATLQDAAAEVPSAGCSSVQWQAELPQPSSRAAAASKAAAAPDQGVQHHHVTLSGLHAPNAHVQAFHTPTGSLPDLPGLDLRAALTTRPPHFICLGTQEAVLEELTARLQNLFGGASVICAATGGLVLPARRTAVAVDSGIPGFSMFAMPAGGRKGGGGRPFQFEAGRAAEAGGEAAEEEAVGGAGCSRGEADGAGSPSSSSSSGSSSSSSGSSSSGSGSSSSGSSSSSSSSGSGKGEGAAAAAPDAARPMVYAGGRAFSAGCSGLVLYPKAAPEGYSAASMSSSSSSGSSSSDARGPPAAAAHCLPPPSRALLAQVLVGGDRFLSLSIPDPATMAHLQPPHTPPALWAAADAVAAQQQQAAGGPGAAGAEGPGPGPGLGPAVEAVEAVEELAVQPVAALPPAVRVIAPPAAAAPAAGGAPAAGATRGRPRAVSPARAASAAGAAGAKAAAADAAPGDAGASQQQQQQQPARRVSAGASRWSVSSQVRACGGTGVPRVAQRLEQLPLVSLGIGFTIFPGEHVQLRIFEKRYQWLLRQAIHQGKSFAVVTTPGLATTVKAVRYHLSGQDFYIVVEGGARVLYDPAAVRTLPATFGLPAAHDAVVVHDQSALTSLEASTITRAAAQILGLLANSAQPQADGGSDFSHALAVQTMQPGKAASSGGSSGRAPPGSSSSSDGGSGGGADGEESLQRAYARRLQDAAQQVPDPAWASRLSLELCGIMPLEVERRQSWQRMFNARTRLAEQHRHFARHRNVLPPTAAALMALPSSHPIRATLGLQSLPPLAS